ncbi:LMBR1-like membrane protein [Carpediemonas membranifera]|uniref:LMBR1-like membrane protein n=1 Tax=Carpediemonas membranifera TaxID=201153 RepID=A0A8J6ASA6_9EUKA|nr:LMBR1-like membrane protein [Carpediemonas membranifera]|eukprot:KAG9390225.1 LMBR1-like membrane protein [Carpediemonas membranifera]
MLLSYANLALLPLLLVAALFVPLYYGERRTVPKYVLAYCGIGLFIFSFVLVSVPLDLSLSYEGNNPQFTIFSIFWRLFYILVLGYTYVLGPFYIQYARSLAPTYWERIKYSLIANAMFFGSMGALFVVILVFLLYGGIISFGNIYNLFIVTANTWGLFCVVVMLGHGLIALPRAIWSWASFRVSLQRAYAELGPVHAAFEKAEAKLRAQMGKAEELLSRESSDTAEGARKRLEHMLAKAPDLSLLEASSGDSRLLKELGSTVNRVRTRVLPQRADALLNSILAPQNDDHGTRKARSGITGRLVDGIEGLIPGIGRAEAVDVSTPARRLTTRSRKLRAAIEEYTRCRQKRTRLLRHIASLERRVGPGAAYRAPPLLGWVPVVIMRPCEVVVLPWLARAVAVAAGVLSALVVLGELLLVLPARTPFVYVTPWYWYLRVLSWNELLMQVGVFLALLYVVTAACYTVLHLRIWMFITITPHGTGSDSLMRMAMYLPRFTPVLALNFLRVNMASRNTAFSAVLDPAGSVPFFSTWFAMLTPLLILVIGVSSAFKLWSRIPKILKLDIAIFSDEAERDAAKQERGMVIAEEAGIDVYRKQVTVDESDFMGLA